MNHMAGIRGTRAVLFLTLLRLTCASPAGRLEPPRRPPDHVWLVDLAGLSESIRAASEQLVAAIFRQAGVDMSFVECLSAPGRPCRQPQGNAGLWLQILAQRPRRVSSDATGFAVLVRSGDPGYSYAAVSYPMVETAAADLEVPVAEVLAASIAHELGHLLLHSSAHFRTGVMRPRVDRRQIALLERGELLFTKEQSVRLVARAAQFAP